MLIVESILQIQIQSAANVDKLIFEYLGSLEPVGVRTDHTHVFVKVKEVRGVHHEIGKAGFEYGQHFTRDVGAEGSDALVGVAFNDHDLVHAGFLKQKSHIGAQHVLPQLVLGGIGQLGHNGCDVFSPLPLGVLDREQQLHQVVVDRRTRGLHDHNLLAQQILEHQLHLPVSEIRDCLLIAHILEFV
eukprot:CAMPEP_0116912678 /NCGR_PEP_ID=MMETSP0467-20121206/16236_1 /TAXON_ID=283647 /ORGANISM="Mesodinium pulex, Strain SPMC105" /LENGTH=186 /DNA_ID=CAMNT_0004588717 /DNA_START=577 /DNA_END=1137 /DNA_ORIENTATION=-